MNMIDNIKKSVNLLKLKAYKNRADIAFYGGTLGTIVGTGLFVRATIKNQSVIERHKNRMAELEDENEAGMYEESEYKKAKGKICRETIKGTAKNYGPAFGVSAVSYAAQGYGVCCKNSQISDLSLALSGAVAALETARQKLEEKEGPDYVAEIFDGVHVEEIRNEEGALVEERVWYDRENPSRFEFLFDDCNPGGRPGSGYSKHPFANHLMITSVLNTLNSDLPIRGGVELREVLDALGYDGKAMIKEHHLFPACGFVYKNLDGSIRGASFGLESKDRATTLFNEGYEPSVLLRMNCVDNIYDYI